MCELEQHAMEGQERPRHNHDRPVAGLTGISSGPPASLWQDVPGVLGHGAASGYPSIVGVVLVCSSIVRRLPVPRN